MAALDYFRQYASEFDNLPDDRVNSEITGAALFIDVSALDAEKQMLATALFAAHLCWLDKYQGNGGGARGVVISERDGDLSRRYGAIKTHKPF